MFSKFLTSNVEGKTAGEITVGVLVMLAITTAAAMWLWNSILKVVLPSTVGDISFFQMFGLIILTHILFC